MTQSTLKIMFSLLQADLIVLWRNKRALIITLLLPIFILISWKSLIKQLGAPFVLSSCITIGIIAIGLMGYPNTVARDRDKGVFQRLRVAPVPIWTIMTSRILVQLFFILIMTSVVFIAGYFVDNITLTFGQYVLSFLAALLGGAVYLSLGQAIVGLVSSAEAVNSVTRLVYFLFILVGIFGGLGSFGETVKKIVQYSPYGAVKSILFAAMQPGTWVMDTWLMLLFSAIYIIVFTFIGIRWFKWEKR